MMAFLLTTYLARSELNLIPAELEPLMPILIPSLIAVVGSIIGAVLVGRRGKEANNTTAFSAVTDKLLQFNDDLTQINETLTARLDDLSNKVDLLQKEGRAKDRKIESLESEVQKAKEVNGRLAGYLGKLVRLWPSGTTLPVPDEPLEWERYL